MTTVRGRRTFSTTSSSVGMDVATWNWLDSRPSESITPPSQNSQCTSIPMYLVAVDLAAVFVVVAMSRLLRPDTPNAWPETAAYRNDSTPNFIHLQASPLQEDSLSWRVAGDATTFAPSC